MEELRRFKIQITIPLSIDPLPIKIHCRLDQSKTSKAMDINTFVEIIPPVGDKYKTPIVIQRNTIYNYSTDFLLGPKTNQNYVMLKASSFLFNIYYIPPAISSPKPKLLAQAKLALGPLQFTSSLSQTLEFNNEDGSDSGFAFECKLSMDKPLVQDEGINIDDIIRVFSIE